MTSVLPPRLRGLALTAHLAVSVGWIGGVASYLALAVAAWTNGDAGTVRASWIGMELIGWYVLVPLALTTLATGLLLSLGTRWGVFRHYWVTVSLLLTVVAAAVLVGHMPTVSRYAALAAGDVVGRTGLRGELLHAGGGLVVLLAIAGLNVYKPPGLTPYGRRKLRERLEESEA